jgi:hypothetical protein
MAARVGVFIRAGLALLMVAMFLPKQATGHSIGQLLDEFMMTSQGDLMAASAAEVTGRPLSVSSETKSVPKAFLFSLLLPGAGQFYAQAPGRGRLFAGAEVAIWTGFVGLHLYSDWKEEDYQLYAAEHAGLDPRSKSQEYFEDVSLFMSMEEYNRRQLKNFREGAELYSTSDFWEWDSDRSRREFDSLYRASTNAEHNAVILTGVALFNHLLSAVDAARSARAYNKRYASRTPSIQLSLSVRPQPRSSMVIVGLKRSF